MQPSEHYPTSEDRVGDSSRYGSAGRILGEEIESQFPPRQPRSPNVVSQLSGFGVDVITLAELQGELLRVDSKDAAKGLVWPIAFATVGAGFLVGCFPLALFGIAWWLTEVTQLTVAQSSLIVASVGLVIAGLVFIRSMAKS